VSAALFLTIVEINGFIYRKHISLVFIQNLEWTLAVSVLVIVQFLCVG